ncbi:heparan sulfate glucosamine 3-O-sulfotransferase 2-like [Mercenaria mercenaria]|uniref:heparan sulfate glucosamine 3-O-sulfotransferase 2-like n=1 Tax=Mercenaria mercenaria TaxID=6596 RepID=UPI00234F40A8|nr:heparan sulfate glucosamine 3-O-sulfotransferase 2-like [Mercenaria mercenaria]
MRSGDMKGRAKKQRNLFLRNAVLVFLIICLFLTYLANDFKTELSEWTRFENETLLREETDASLGNVEYLDLRMGHSRVLKNKNSKALDGTSNFNISSITRKLPNAIIIGVKKCGTRALLEYLRLHPNIKAAGPEPHFFDRYYHMGLEWYRQKMPRSGVDQLTIEKTPRYFVTEVVPERIYNMSKTIKLILVVRNPVTRALSDFTQAVSKGEYNSSVTFQSRAIRRDGAINIKWSAVNIGLYAYHLKRWLDIFPLESIHVVDGENLIRNPVQELNVVQNFLGIDIQIPAEIIYMNATKGFPCILQQQKTPPFRCFRSSKGRQHSYADKKTLTLLRNFYEPYNIDFYRMIKRQFFW